MSGDVNFTDFMDWMDNQLEIGSSPFINSNLSFMTQNVDMNMCDLEDPKNHAAFLQFTPSFPETKRFVKTPPAPFSPHMEPISSFVQNNATPFGFSQVSPQNFLSTNATYNQTQAYSPGFLLSLTMSSEGAPPVLLSSHSHSSAESQGPTPPFCSDPGRTSPTSMLPTIFSEPTFSGSPETSASRPKKATKSAVAAKGDGKVKIWPRRFRCCPPRRSSETFQEPHFFCWHCRSRFAANDYMQLFAHLDVSFEDLRKSILDFCLIMANSDQWQPGPMYNKFFEHFVQCGILLLARNSQAFGEQIGNWKFGWQCIGGCNPTSSARNTKPGSLREHLSRDKHPLPRQVPQEVQDLLQIKEQSNGYEVDNRYAALVDAYLTEDMFNVIIFRRPHKPEVDFVGLPTASENSPNRFISFLHVKSPPPSRVECCGLVIMHQQRRSGCRQVLQPLIDNSQPREQNFDPETAYKFLLLFCLHKGSFLTQSELIVIFLGKGDDEHRQRFFAFNEMLRAENHFASLFEPTEDYIVPCGGNDAETNQNPPTTSISEEEEEEEEEESEPEVSSETEEEESCSYSNLLEESASNLAKLLQAKNPRHLLIILDFFNEEERKIIQQKKGVLCNINGTNEAIHTKGEHGRNMVESFFHYFVLGNPNAVVVPVFLSLLLPNNKLPSYVEVMRGFWLVSKLRNYFPNCGIILCLPWNIPTSTLSTQVIDMLDFELKRLYDENVIIVSPAGNEDLELSASIGSQQPAENESEAKLFPASSTYSLTVGLRDGHSVKGGYGKSVLLHLSSSLLSGIHRHMTSYASIFMSTLISKLICAYPISNSVILRQIVYNCMTDPIMLKSGQVASRSLKQSIAMEYPNSTLSATIFHWMLRVLSDLQRISVNAPGTAPTQSSSTLKGKALLSGMRALYSHIITQLPQLEQVGKVRATRSKITPLLLLLREKLGSPNRSVFSGDEYKVLQNEQDYLQAQQMFIDIFKSQAPLEISDQLMVMRFLVTEVMFNDKLPTWHGLVSHAGLIDEEANFPLAYFLIASHALIQGKSPDHDFIFPYMPNYFVWKPFIIQFKIILQVLKHEVNPYSLTEELKTVQSKLLDLFLSGKLSAAYTTFDQLSPAGIGAIHSVAPLSPLSVKLKRKTTSGPLTTGPHARISTITIYEDQVFFVPVVIGIEITYDYPKPQKLSGGKTPSAVEVDQSTSPPTTTPQLPQFSMGMGSFGLSGPSTKNITLGVEEWVTEVRYRRLSPPIENFIFNLEILTNHGRIFTSSHVNEMTCGFRSDSIVCSPAMPPYSSEPSSLSSSATSLSASTGSASSLSSTHSILSPSSSSSSTPSLSLFSGPENVSSSMLSSTSLSALAVEGKKEKMFASFYMKSSQAESAYYLRSISVSWE